MSIKPAQIGIVLAVGLLIGAIYYSGRNTSEGSFEIDPAVKPEDQTDWDYNIGLTIEDLLKVDSIASFMKEVYPKNQSQDSLVWLQTAASAWDSLGHDLMAGYYFEKVARKTQVASDWYSAASKFFSLQNLAPDSFVRNQLSEHSLECLKKTVELDPSNLKAKAELGVSYMENPNMPPMAGIGLLREVIQIDPDHTEALYYLGYLSMKSGQYDKAVERLSRLTELHPERAEYYQYLGQAYLQLGDKENAKIALSAYAERETREEARNTALKLIEELNN